MKESFRAICVRHDFLFVHVPKTAGISFLTAVFGHTGLGHDSLRDFQSEFSDAAFARLFKFALVRNPWDRLYSAYHYLKCGGRNAMDREWAAANLAEVDDFESFVLTWLTPERLSSIAHLQPQLDFIRDASGEIAVDLLGRYEHIDDTYESVRRELERRGLSNLPPKLPRLNQGPYCGVDYRREYSRGARERVEELYRCDVEAFGYSFEKNDRL